MTARKPDRNFAVAPTVPELAEMLEPDDPDCTECGEPRSHHSEGPPYDTDECDGFSYIRPEPHDPRCDCKDCAERAESQQDDLEQAQIHDIEREP